MKHEKIFISDAKRFESTVYCPSVFLLAVSRDFPSSRKVWFVIGFCYHYNIISNNYCSWSLLALLFGIFSTPGDKWTKKQTTATK